MDKRVALILLAALLAAAAASLVWAEAKRTPDWQIALQRTLRDRLDGERQWVVLDMATARNPEAFAAHTAQPVVLDWTWEHIEIPYPPRALVCILIAPAGSLEDDADARLLFVGHHSDNLWRQGWIVHQGPEAPFTSHAQATLFLLGCDLALPADGPGQRAMRFSPQDGAALSRGATA